MPGTSTEQRMRGVDALAYFLELRRAPYEVMEHAPTFAAIGEARAAGTPPAEMAKTVVLHDHHGLRIAVIPASERVDLHRVRALLRGSAHLRLATEEEIDREFPAFDPGATPPFGALLETLLIVDLRLLECDSVACSGGDHTHTLRISPRQLLRLGRALVADICEQESIHPSEALSYRAVERSRDADHQEADFSSARHPEARSR